MSILNETGALGMASRLQKLSDSLRRDVNRIYRQHGIGFEAKWFPVIYVLSRKSPLTVIGLAAEIGYAHPSVIALVKELHKAGLVRIVSDKSDRRKRMLSLTPKAGNLVRRMIPLWDKMKKTAEKLIDNEDHLLEAIRQTEDALDKESFYDRVEKKTGRKKKK